MFCTKCGEALSDKAKFCTKCGARTIPVKAANVEMPTADRKDILTEVGEELNKAFTVASKEIEKALTTAEEELRKVVNPEPVKCPNCGEKNSSGAQFCTKCGGKI